jgi:hypothetical protein
MGCASFTTKKQLRVLSQSEIPNFFKRKTQIESGDSEKIYSKEVGKFFGFEQKPQKAPILCLEANIFRNKRILKPSAEQ